MDDSDATDDRLVNALDEVTDTLTHFVIPLYVEERGRPFQVGTGFFVRAGPVNFLVSAAHVLELGPSLFYYIEPNVTAKLSGEWRLSRWDGDRENDPVDVGVLKLNQSNPPYPKVEKYAVEVSCLQPGLTPRSNKIYSIIGFPASQSKVNPVGKEVRSTGYAFRNRSIPDKNYAALGCSPQNHVVLSVDLEDGVDSEGRQRNFPKPQGMSGSPIFMLLDEDQSRGIRSFPIVGIGTKYRRAERALIGTDIAIAVAMINEAKK